MAASLPLSSPSEVRISFPERYMNARRRRILFSAPSKLFPLQTKLAAQIGVHASILFWPVLAGLAILLIPMKLLHSAVKRWLHRLDMPQDDDKKYYSADNEWMETRKEWHAYPHKLEVGISFFEKGNKVARPGGGYDPNRPTMLYVHGWERGTTCRGMRETFNWKSNYEWAEFSDAVDIDACDFWIARGWNVAIFYWSQVSDERKVTQAERKIYENAKRYHVVDYSNKKNLWKFEPMPDDLNKPIADALVEAFHNALHASKEKIVIVGHSLGSQLVLEATRRMCERAASPLPSRVVLCDAFFSKGRKHYLNNQSTAQRALESAKLMIKKGILLEWYHTSLLGDLGWFCGCAFAGDRADALRRLASFVKLDPPLIPWWDVAARHISAANIYFLSAGLVDDDGSEEENDLRPVDEQGRTFPVLADTPDDVIKERMQSIHYWEQHGPVFLQKTRK